MMMVTNYVRKNLRFLVKLLTDFLLEEPQIIWLHPMMLIITLN